MVDTGLTILEIQEFLVQKVETESEIKNEIKSETDIDADLDYELDLLKSHLLSVQASVTIQLNDHVTASTANSQCLRIRQWIHPGPYYKTYLTDSVSINLASWAAATDNCKEARDLLHQALKKAQEHGAGTPEARDITMRAATMAGKVHIFLEEFGEVEDLLNLASSIFNPATDNPMYMRVIDHVRGSLCYEQKDLAKARDHFTNAMLFLQYGTVMHSSQPDQECTISIYYKLALIDVDEERDRCAV
jgi:hypothetical protein